MPKSIPTSSPSTTNALPASAKSSTDDTVNKLSDVALRKKKNADAQAAFRARRANYIATLEETVTSLESVVLQLQDSCREARREAIIHRNENAYLRYEYREREKFWRALWSAKKSGPEELPPMPPLFYACAQPVPLPIPMNGHVNLQHYNHDQLSYRSVDDAVACHGPYGGPSQLYQNHASSSTYPGTNTEMVTENIQPPLNARMSKYNGYAYAMQTPGGDIAPGGQTSHSPPFGDSPPVTSDMSYLPRFAGEEQKVSLNGLDGASLVFPTSRSLSPTSTPGSASTTSLTSPFQFTFSEHCAGHNRADLDYRRHSHPHGTDVTLHSGPADITLSGSTADAIRYRLGAKKSVPGTERSLLPCIPLSTDTCAPHDKEINDENCTIYSSSRLRSRRAAASRSSRSPSPPPLSGTLAVIKAQAFGALRRTRARTKRTSDGAAKVAMDVLEGRGIGMNTTAGTKRPRLHGDSINGECS